MYNYFLSFNISIIDQYLKMEISYSFNFSKISCYMSFFGDNISNQICDFLMNLNIQSLFNIPSYSTH